jgi:predicted nucleic acid-binding protein
MPADRFLDTNVLLYAYDLDAPAKRAVARAIVEEAWLQPLRTALSVQVNGSVLPKALARMYSVRKSYSGRRAPRKAPGDTRPQAK